MWLQAPENFGGITVENIAYQPEVVAKGKTYFRAADHLVPAILSTGLGFAVCDPPEGTDLPDLPRSDPLRDGAIADGQRELAQLRATVDQQKSELSLKSAEAAEFFMEREGLRLKVHNLEAELANIKGDYEELRADVPAHILKKFDEKVKAREEEEAAR